jgi:hypothetical protein
MKIAGVYSFNGGLEAAQDRYENEFAEVEKILGSVRAQKLRTKESHEKTMPGKMLYSPKALNGAISKKFLSLGWQKHKVPCEYPTGFYKENYTPKSTSKGAFREMDFVKNHLGVEVQFGKYAFMVYNVCAKMTIFHNMGIINTGIEIVPLKVLADEMSTGVSYFEQFVWDLEHRGVSNIDIPVLILGVIP